MAERTCRRRTKRITQVFFPQRGSFFSRRNVLDPRPPYVSHSKMDSARSRHTASILMKKIEKQKAPLYNWEPTEIHPSNRSARKKKCRRPRSAPTATRRATVIARRALASATPSRFRPPRIQSQRRLCVVATSACGTSSPPRWLMTPHSATRRAVMVCRSTSRRTS